MLQNDTTSSQTRIAQAAFDRTLLWMKNQGFCHTEGFPPVMIRSQEEMVLITGTKGAEAMTLLLRKEDKCTCGHIKYGETTIDCIAIMPGLTLIEMQMRFAHEIAEALIFKHGIWDLPIDMREGTGQIVAHHYAKQLLEQGYQEARDYIQEIENHVQPIYHDGFWKMYREMQKAGGFHSFVARLKCLWHS